MGRFEFIGWLLGVVLASIIMLAVCFVCPLLSAELIGVLSFTLSFILSLVGGIIGSTYDY